MSSPPRPPLRRRLTVDTNTLDWIAGITGFGWTASVLGYLTAVIGYGSALVANPQSLLYLGVVLFVTTAGLDGFNRVRSDETD